jgi:quercetin dioxygenase-like cupin family protein
MLGRSFVGLVLIAGLAVASTAAAQDPIKSNPKVYPLVFENSTVRVLHVSVAPGQKTVLHEHPDNAVWCSPTARCGSPAPTASRRTRS